GDVLMCQARPGSDCVLRIPSNVVQSADTTLAPARRQARIVATRRLTADVIHFNVVLSRPMTFKAGQFAVLETTDVTGGRAYSMVNYNEEAEQLSFVVKRKPWGGFSEWLFTTDVVGHELRLFG